MADPDTPHEVEDFAGDLADAAAKITLRLFRTPLTVDDKSKTGAFDPVTRADREAEQAMRDLIETRYPGDGISGEEFGDKPGTSGRIWHLDPIDGTRSFVIGLPLWGSLIGLADGAEPIFGMMDQPFTGERYIGASGQARLVRQGTNTKLKTSERHDLAAAHLATTDPRLFTGGEQVAFQQLADKARLTRFGGDCYLYCQLAAGHVDLVAETGLKAHDIIPLIPLIRLAGGVVTDWQGRETITGGRVLASANRTLHDAALDVLNP
jgi:myo-inositol-1(or 4)-monophosphatase